MAINEELNSDQGVIISCLSTDTKPTTYAAGAIAYETDGAKDKYEFNGDSWLQMSVGGAAKVSGVLGVMQQDDYSAPALSTAATRIAIPTDANGNTAVGVEIGNEDATPANMIKALFGDVNITATATEGHLIHAASVRQIPIRTDYTHLSLVALAGTPTANLVWHFPG